MTTTPEQAVIQALDMFETLKNLNSWLGAVADVDFDEVVADGGITAGMVVRQEASEQQRRVREAIADECRHRLAHSKPPSEGLRELLREMFDAMVRYEMDVDADAPAAHRDMMERVRAALQPLTEPQRLGQEGEAYDIASRISVSEFPGKTFTERLENARIVLAALTPAQAEPVAWMYRRYDGYLVYAEEQDHKRLPPWCDEGLWTETPLYAIPSTAQDRDAVVEAMTDAIQKQAQDGDDSPVDRGDAERLARAALDALGDLK